MGLFHLGLHIDNKLLYTHAILIILCVCLHVFVSACVHICMRAFVHACACVCIGKCLRVCASVCMYLYD